MNESTTLTNRERRENVAFIGQVWLSGHIDPPFTPLAYASDTTHGVYTKREDLGPNIYQRHVSVDSEDFFTLLCYHVLRQQPAPASVIEADWRRFIDAGVISELWSADFDLTRFALDPPVCRQDSKGKLIDFVRIRETVSVWQRLLPTPPDTDVAVDVLHAASGGALKSQAFCVIRDMVQAGYWTDENLLRFAMNPGSKTRKRAIRMGLIDLPEKADTFADMKAVSRAMHAVLRLGESPKMAFSDTIEFNEFKCEVCDAARMASCPVPHCRWRREHVEP